MVALKYREKELIRRLLTKGHMTGSALALKLDVSSRTVRNDIQMINEQINDLNLWVVGSSNGYSLKGDTQAFKDLLSDIESNDFGDPQNRENYLVHLLLQSNELSFFDLVELLNVSESTIRNDIKRLNQYFEELDESFTIHILKNKVSIAHESEEHIRIAFTALIHNIYHANFITLSFWEKQGVHVANIRQALVAFLKEEESYLQQNDYIYLLDYLVIMIFRRQYSYLLEDTKHESKYASLFEKLSKEGYSLLPIEQTHVIQLFDSLNQLQYQATNKNHYPMIDNLLKQIDGLFMTEFKADSQLIKSLNSHLGSILKKQLFSLPTPYEFIENVEHLYPFSYTVAQYFTQELQNESEFSDLDFKETEIILLTIYFELSLERTKTSTEVRAFLVSDRGRAATSLLQTQLMSKLPNLQILMTLPPIAINQLELFSADIILSTTELVDIPENIKVIVLSLPLTNEDIHHINSFIDSNYFWKKTIYNNVVEVNKNVKTMSELFEFVEQFVSKIEGYDVEIATSLSEREKLRTTYLGRQLVMPHGLIKDELKYNLYVLHSPSGIEWNGQQASVIICILINDQARKNMNNYMKLVNGLYETLKENEFNYRSTDEIIEGIEWSHNEI